MNLQNCFDEADNDEYMHESMPKIVALMYVKSMSLQVVTNVIIATSLLYTSKYAHEINAYIQPK